ncbi:MAG TPA: hypothetical protein VNY31_06970 [Solirubrobacteraceae bacterium]|jgi:hypothetical protein|nr:hypothetical protein [Solirubrobacteraceae bacterium]
MRSHVRVSLVALIVSASVAIAAPAAQAAVPFGVEKFAAANCKASFEGCVGETATVGPFEYSIPKEPSLAEAEEQDYTQAAGHPPWGVTDFKVNTEGTFPNEVPAGLLTTGPVKHVRTDVGPGVSTNPEAMPQCTIEEFGNKEAVPGTGFYFESKCVTVGKGSTVIGVNKVTVYAGPGGVSKSPEISDLPLEGTAYNVVPPEGRASDFGVALKLPIPLTGAKLKAGFEAAEKAGAKPGVGGFPLLPEQEFLEAQQYYAHTMIEGNVEWASDYHDYYEINVSTAIPLISSRLVLKGDVGSTEKGGYITNPSNCAGSGPATTNNVTLEAAGGTIGERKYIGLIGTEGCKGEAPFAPVPFVPGFSLASGVEESQSDLPDGITTELSLPHDPSPTGIDSSQLENAVVTLPEGMTLNPSAARGLEACTPAQARIHSATFGVACPAASKLGTVALEVPTLPAGSLTGNIYLGGPESGPIRGGTEAKPEYTMYLNAESKRYGIDVRLEGTVTPDPTTGQVTATFAKNPEQPFSNVKLKFNGGALAPIANPLACGTATATTSLTPYTGTAAQSPTGSIVVDGNGKGGACPSPIPFALSQETKNQPPGEAGAKTSYTLNLARTDGQQYLSQIKTVLPAGLVGLIPTVPLCGEPQAGKGECSPASQIGVVGVEAGSGPSPYQFAGQVYLTGPYNGAPFGLTIETSGVAGPFDLGSGPCDCVLSRGTIEVDPYTARVTATSTLPTIVKGVPLRLKKVTVNMNRQGFLVNPTNCGVLATETTLTSTLGATQTLSSPFQVSNCSKLAFKPKFGSATSAKTSKANGASLETTINMPAGNANVKSVLVQLPKQLPSRLTTLQKACPEKTFANNYNECPPGSFVGGARANTPTLPGKLSGPAILVSHGGQAFPDLDLVMNANGVRVILVGNTNIKNGITTTNFAANPDVPVSSITVNLPTGAHSALSANGSLCANKLVMPTTMVGQNGTTFKQNTTIKVKNCPVRIVGHRVIGNTAYLSVQTYSPGRISGSGADLATTYRHLSQPQRSASLKVSLSRAGRSRGRPFSARVRVGFVPKKKGTPSSVAYVTVRFG